MELTVSPAPHIHDNLTVSKCMYNVIIALLPAFAVSLYFFGIGAFIVTLSSILSCVIVEYLIQKYLLKEKPSIGNGSAILTGLLLAFQSADMDRCHRFYRCDRDCQNVFRRLREQSFQSGFGGTGISSHILPYPDDPMASANRITVELYRCRDRSNTTF